MPHTPRRSNMSGVPEFKSKQTAGSAHQPSPIVGDDAQGIHRSTRFPWTAGIPGITKTLHKNEPEAEIVRARQNKHDQHAKIAEKRARGAHATHEIICHIDTRLKGLKLGKLILETLDNCVIQYRYELKEGRLPEWPTITWHRDSGTV